MDNLPSEWASATVGEICEYLQRGKTPRYAEFSSLPVINQKCIRWTGIQAEHLKFIHPDQISEWPKEKFIKNGDILLNSTGTGTLGRACLVTLNDSMPGKVVDSHVTIIRVNIGIAHPKFVFYWFKGPTMQRLIDELSTGTTNQIELNRSTISGIVIPLAPISDQEYIVEKLDGLLSCTQLGLEHVEKLLSTCRRLKQTIILAAIRGTLYQSTSEESQCEQVINVEEPYKHSIHGPKNWNGFLLGDVCALEGGSQPPKSTFSSLKSDDYVRLIQIRDYKSDRYVTYIPRSLARRFCNSKDIMIGRYGPPIFQILRGLEGAYNVALMKVIPKCELVSEEYLYYFLQNEVLLRFVEAGSERTAGQDGVRKELVLNYPIFLPSIEEQERIAALIKNSLDRLTNIETKIMNAKTMITELPSSILAQAFSGKFKQTGKRVTAKTLK
ncbi:MAG: restriction endonuclease subunit S [Candidatus Obscuribacterales bacterium]|jgi:type I restriction enzyme S subunit